MRNFMIKNNNELFDGFDGFFRPFFSPTKDLMRTDVHETDAEYVYNIEVPGFNKEDITVSYEDEYVTVSAKREEVEEGKTYLRRERNCSCERNFYVGDIDKTQIKAKYENGVLTLTIPKDVPKKPEVHNIAIE